jgi:hypothetical protein
VTAFVFGRMTVDEGQQVVHVGCVLGALPC